jgi:hypothetical protein
MSKAKRDKSDFDAVVMFVNISLLANAAADKIETLGISVRKVTGKAWLLGITLPNGQTVAAYPISILNPIAPPSIYMTDSECDTGMNNREPPSKIARKLSKWCKDSDLTPAIKLLKRAIKGLET